ncbi:hypothetical protein NDU88_005329 [Pleurodeles waltl]|uniref:Uncharacterized protein n=1 Tax=Pleurodeles waltl TaxID=8319 RepID=A0AAV7WWQ9_PLEWA|nr:hypothetical protein NDU88_005329 [Pleurodeles waltl]
MERNGRIRRTLAQKTRKPLSGRAERHWNLERRSPVSKTKTAGPWEPMNEPPRFRRSVATPETNKERQKEKYEGKEEPITRTSGEEGKIGKKTARRVKEEKARENQGVK